MNKWMQDSRRRRRVSIGEGEEIKRNSAEAMNGIIIEAPFLIIF